MMVTKMRRGLWEEQYGWSMEDEGRIFRGDEVLPEDLQDYTKPMVIIGNDVVNLYPSCQEGSHGV